MFALSLLFGAIVGLSLGLTGGGGAIFAVPLLVFGLGTPARTAVGVSLAAVGATALIGFLIRLRNRQVDVKTGLMFAAAGMLGAPVGTWAAGQMSEGWLMLLFGCLMAVVAVLMWPRPRSTNITAEMLEGVANDGATCRRDRGGTLILTTRCSLSLLLLGLLTGALSGLFGVGGGFVIVPALVWFTGMPIHRAVGTSLMVVSLISASGVTSHVLSGRAISPGLTSLFILGGVAGLIVGQAIGQRLSGPSLQRVFAVAIVGVALFVISHNLWEVASRPAESTAVKEIGPLRACALASLRLSTSLNHLGIWSSPTTPGSGPPSWNMTFLANADWRTNGPPPIHSLFFLPLP